MGELFDLSGKRLVPTAAGLAVLEAAGDVWRALDRCERALTVWRPPAPASSDQRTARASGPAPDLEAPWDHAAPRAVENGPFP